MSQLSQIKDLSGLSQATTGILANFSSLLKEGETVRFSAGDQVAICSSLVTVEYCLDTTTQLQDKMRQKVETNLVEKIQFLGEVELLQSVTTNCVSLLVQELEAGCDLAMVNMIRVNWAGIEQVGDQSQYVSALVSAIRTMVPRLRDCLQTSRKYFTQFCIKFVSSFIPKFLANIYKCKPLGTVGAEQLLLDTHRSVVREQRSRHKHKVTFLYFSIKTVLLDLPSIVDSGQVKLPPGARKPPQSYTKLVIKGEPFLHT